MAFEKENTKGRGRPSGSKNRKTEEWQIFSDWMMGEGLIRFRQEMSKLKGRDYVITVKDMMEYFQPKLARTELTGKDGQNLGVIVYLPNGSMETIQEAGDSSPKQLL